MRSLPRFVIAVHICRDLRRWPAVARGHSVRRFEGWACDRLRGILVGLSGDEGGRRCADTSWWPTRRWRVIVSSNTCASCLATGPSWFFVLVPATPIHIQVVPGEGEAELLARQRLEGALARFRGEGASVVGAVGDPSPLRAVSDALRQQSFDEIVLSTLPPGTSRWLVDDLPSRLARATWPPSHAPRRRRPTQPRGNRDSRVSGDTPADAQRGDRHAQGCRREQGMDPRNRDR